MYPTLRWALGKYYPRPSCAPSFIKWRKLSILPTHLLFSWNSLHVYTWRTLGYLLVFRPLGQNPAVAIIHIPMVNSAPTRLFKVMRPAFFCHFQNRRSCVCTNVRYFVAIGVVYSHCEIPERKTNHITFINSSLGVSKRNKKFFIFGTCATFCFVCCFVLFIYSKLTKP